jgi:AP-1 complex subunit beta-1
MGCLRADKILDYLCEPLRKCLKDESPYVRKTAAICVAKLYDLKSQLAIENGFVGALVEMLSDANPMVVANAVTALLEIQETISGRGDGSSLFTVDSRLLGRLLIALGECTEWGRIAILAAVSSYRAVDEKEAEHICERVVPQFQHANASVVLAAVQVRDSCLSCWRTRPNNRQVILVHLRTATRPDFIKGMLRKMAPPLGALTACKDGLCWKHVASHPRVYCA